jgi:hypothetical protein
VAAAPGSKKSKKSQKSLLEQLSKRKTLQVALVVIAALVLAGNFIFQSLGESVTPAEGAEGSALEALGQLEVGVWEDEDGYDRKEFGTAWKDVDKNRCDTRNDILARDLEEFEYTPGDSCQIASGTLQDPYTGEEIDFVRGPRSADVQIDHIVALKNAWITGAYSWDREKREQIANDPLNLVASDGPANMSKGDRDTSRWLPDNASYRCEYVAAQVAVKVKYELWVTQDEHDAMTEVLTSCPAEPLPTDGL